MASIGPVQQWQETLDSHRAWVRGWLAEPGADYDGDWQVKLQLVCAICPHVPAQNTAAWQALGVVFGDALGQALNLTWGEVVDELGTDPVLVVDVDREAVLFPLTMLSKRVEQGEVLDRDGILALFSAAAGSVGELNDGR